MKFLNELLKIMIVFGYVVLLNRGWYSFLCVVFQIGTRLICVGSKKVKIDLIFIYVIRWINVM